MEQWRELIESCRNGEKRGWSQLFETYAEPVFNSLLSFGADRDLAGDILGDSFIHLMEKNAYRLREATFQSESQFQWWLIIIARNLLRSRQ